MRINKPIGLLLLLWPTLWALWLASQGIPTIKTLTIFVLGVWLMRTAGCVINDYTDRKIDGYVKRTCNRPLPSGVIKSHEAILLFIVLISLSFILVLMLHTTTIVLSIIALVLMWIYPFMKQYIYLPQLILGIAFSWSIPMVFMEINKCLTVNCWLLFLTNVIWTISYDTQYAMIDRDDDLRIGIKSTAILFGRKDAFIIGLLQLITLVLLTIIGYRMELSRVFYLTLLGVAGLFFWQKKLIIRRKRQAYYQAFLNNNFIGMLVFIGIALSFL